MKKVSLIVLALSMSLFMAAQENAKGVVFEHGTLDQALAKAASAKKNAPKFVFVDCYTTWCGPCKFMTNTVFPMEHVGEYFNKNFVNIKLDMEKEENKEVSKKYNVAAYPTFLILDAKGNEINRIVGSIEADEFIEIVKKRLDPSSHPSAIKAAYERNKSFYNAIAYIQAAELSYWHKELQKFIEEIFPALPPSERYSEKLWPYLIPFLSDPNSYIFNTVLVEKPEADKYLTKEKVDAALRTGLTRFASAYLNGRYKELSKDDILNKLNYLSYLDGSDLESQMILKIARLFSENKINEIESLLNMKTMSGLNDASRGRIENMINSIAGISKESKLKYSISKFEYYNNVVTKLKGEIDRMQK